MKLNDNVFKRLKEARKLGSTPRTQSEQLIMAEYNRAKELHPDWPKDIIHQVAIVCEESGELLKAVLDYESGKGSHTDIITEAIHTGAMVLRFLENVQDIEDCGEECKL